MIDGDEERRVQNEVLQSQALLPLQFRAEVSKVLDQPYIDAPETSTLAHHNGTISRSCQYPADIRLALKFLI
ncbi:MAG: hypothetical protein JO217_07220 [Acidobacteriaceae bacterium]|nr:hypothetical protein [Acidobacteriaceae bacterium]